MASVVNYRGDTFSKPVKLADGQVHSGFNWSNPDGG
jgi:hypothetical protein